MRMHGLCPECGLSRDLAEDYDRLRAIVEELRECLIYACNQLEGYEETSTGESYNDTRINAILAKTAKENQQ